MKKHQQIYQNGKISVIYSDFCSQSASQEPTKKKEDDWVWVFSYCLEGKTAYQDKAAEEIVFTKGQSTACIHKHCSGMRIVPSNSHVKQLRISVPEQALLDYFSKQSIHRLTENVSSVKKLFSTNLSPHSLTSIQSLLWHIRYRDLLQAHIGILNLINDNIDNLGIKNPSTLQQLSQRDIKLAEEARKLFDYDCTLRISDIATALNVTEQKLRLSFTNYFNISPKQYSLQVKMTKAKSLLAAGVSVNETAYSLGYEFPNNFTLAFKKYFGKAPSLLNKNNETGIIFD